MLGSPRAVAHALSVVMATYNGARFLQAQLDSLLAQTVFPGELVIGDDGSDDGTIEILTRFKQYAPFPVKLLCNSRLGFADNFLTAAAQASGRWISFCDQDDVWHPDKLERVARTLEGPDCDLVLIVQGATLVSPELKPLDQQSLRPRRERRIPRLGHHGFWVWPGFCLTVRAELIQHVPFTRRPGFGMNGLGIAHDRWICILANALGSSLTLPGASALYRRHPESVGVSNDGEALSDERVSPPAGDRAEAFANVMRELSNEVKVESWRGFFLEAAEAYGALSGIEHARARMQASPRMERARLFFSVAAAGGYIGRPFVSAGARQLVIDAGRMVSR